MDASETNCPSCGAPFDTPIIAGRRECSYCGAVFEIDMPVNAENKEIQPDKNDNEKYPALRMFQINPDRFSDAGRETWKTLCSCLNCEYTYEKYLELFSDMANSNEDIATPTVHSELFRSAKSGISVPVDETLLLWKNGGVFSKSKVGMFLTDKSILFVKKSKVKKVLFKDIKSIHSDSGSSWYINGDISMYASFDTICCSNIQLGIIMAFACSRARDLNPEGYKISVD